MSDSPRPLIWIVDDSSTEAAITRHSLGVGYDFEYFPDGAIVVERLTSAEIQPDVLLLDWVMPGMTGDEVCRFLRGHDRTKELPIIIVTGSRLETADLVHGLACGANDYVPRPFAPEELRARVNVILRTKELAETSLRERRRLTAVNELAQVLLRASGIDQILEGLATVFSQSLCDGCGVMLLSESLDHRLVARHRRDASGGVLAAISMLADPCVRAFTTANDAAKQLPPAYANYVSRFGLTGLAIIALPASSPVQGVLTLTRDGASKPFDAEDITTIEACLEFCALAMQNALRFDAERVGRAQLHTVLEKLPVGIVLTDAQGGLVLANDSAAALLPGIEDARDLSGVYRLARWFTLEHQLIDQRDWVVEHALFAGTAVHAEIIMHLPGDMQRRVMVSGVPLLDARAVVVGSVTMISDVSAERAIAAERDRVARFQEEMLAIVGHDLRNPLGALLAGIDLMQESPADAARIGIVARLRSSTNRMVKIVDQLLDVTHARLGQGIPLELRETSLTPIVKALVEELGLAHPKARFELRGHGDHVGVWDGDRLSQVIGNLMSNAANYGLAGGPVVVELQGTPHATSILVRNPVRDQPISPEQQAVLFDPFQRGRQTTANAGGLGLGLYIVREIVLAHGGTVAVESTTESTTFTIVLPNRRPTAPAT
ncbi:MAG: ATP-binding protein [Kofleriaceae bacterium]